MVALHCIQNTKASDIAFDEITENWSLIWKLLKNKHQSTLSGLNHTPARVFPVVYTVW